MIYIHFCATNDANGNPRRCYAIIDTKGKWRAVLDEGYVGIQVVLRWAERYRFKVNEAGAVNITPAEYRTLIRAGKELPAERGGDVG